MAETGPPQPVADDGQAGAARPPLVHRIDLVVAAMILVVAGALYYATSRFDQVSPMLAQNIPPEYFPRLLLGTITVLSLLLPFEHLLQRWQGKDSLAFDRRRPIRPMAFATAGLLCIVVAAMTFLGTLLTMVVVCALMPPLWGERRLKVIVPFAIIFPGIVALVFSQFLKVYFEPGVLGLTLH